MTQHDSGRPAATDRSVPDPVAEVSLRGPAELADALPYLLGFHPDDSIVLVALHGEAGRFGGRIRTGIPAATGEWPAVARQLASCLESGSVSRGGRPDGVVVFLCQDPARGEPARAVSERLRPLARSLRTACGALGMPVFEALCLSGGRYWSYTCPDPGCCPPEGAPAGPSGTSAMAAAAVYAGIRVRGSLREMEARLAPLGPALAEPQRRALDAAAADLVPRMLREDRGRTAVRAETVVRARRLMGRLRAAPGGQGEGGGDTAVQDARDDALVPPGDAATVILGLQDRGTRDQAAEWMEGRDAPAALRLWRTLARRCVGPYREHAAAPLTLAGWVAWSTGDEAFARVAFGRALETDPGYVFAQLLHRACNEGLDPEPLRRCMREERAARRRRGARRRPRGSGGRGGGRWPDRGTG